MFKCMIFSSSVKILKKSSNFKPEEIGAGTSMKALARARSGFIYLQ